MATGQEKRKEAKKPKKITEKKPYGGKDPASQREYIKWGEGWQLLK